MRAVRWAMLMAAILAALVAGCTPGRSGAGEVEVSDAVSPAPPAGTVPMAVFFEEGLSQRLLPEVRYLPGASPETMANMLAKELISGPSLPFLHRPFEAGIELAAPIQVTDGTADVNLTRWFEEGSRHGSDVPPATEAFALTLTDVPGIHAVIFRVRGEMRVGPVKRPFLDGEVAAGPERIRSAQDRAARGLDRWRTDPAAVVGWEGRAFGFTADELRAASVEVQGDQAVATGLVREGRSYRVELTRHATAWLVRACSTAQTGGQ